MIHLRRRLIGLAALSALAAAPVASAQDPGVTIDPDAPSSKEYAIPLEDARRQAAGGAERLGRQAQGERSAPLFGEGIGEEPGAEAPSAQGSSGSGERRRGRREPAESTRREDDAPTVTRRSDQEEPTTVRASASSDGDLGGPLTIAALAGSVLLLGSVIGSMARRRRSS